MTLAPGAAAAGLTARNATAAVAAGCWPHLATGSGREASVYLQVHLRPEQAGSGSSGQQPALSAVISSLLCEIFMVEQGPSSLRHVHGV